MAASSVEFPTATRVHVGLSVADLDASRRFYVDLLDMQPTKEREGYIKFESHNPPINLTLNARGDGAARPAGAVTHFGIQVKSTAASSTVTGRPRLSLLPGQGLVMAIMGRDADMNKVASRTKKI